MDYEHPRSPAPGSLLELEGPTPVVCERLAAEEVVVVGRRLVRKEHQQLAADIDSLEVVPLEFRRYDAVPDEDHVGVKHFPAGLTLVVAHVLGQGLELAPGQAHAGAALGLDLNQWHRLEVGAAFAGRFRTGQLQLGGQVFYGQFLAAPAYSAPFQQVMGQEPHMRRNVIGRDQFCVGRPAHAPGSEQDKSG